MKHFVIKFTSHTKTIKSFLKPKNLNKLFRIGISKKSNTKSCMCLLNYIQLKISHNVIEYMIFYWWKQYVSWWVIPTNRKFKKIAKKAIINKIIDSWMMPLIIKFNDFWRSAMALIINVNFLTPLIIEFSVKNYLIFDWIQNCSLYKPINVVIILCTCLNIYLEKKNTLPWKIVCLQRRRVTTTYTIRLFIVELR